MGYGLCRHCARGKCSRWRHWRIRCRLCDRFRIFRGPSCAPCHAEAHALVADMVAEMFEN